MLYTKPYLNFVQMRRDTENLEEIVVRTAEGGILSVYQNQYVLVAYKLDSQLSQVQQFYRCDYGEFFDPENEQCIGV